jgi:hypothetical protein
MTAEDRLRETWLRRIFVVYQRNRKLKQMKKTLHETLFNLDFPPDAIMVIW